MRRSGTPDGGGHPRRRPGPAPANPTQPDLQSLIASAYLHEQRRRRAAELEVGRNAEHLSGVIATQNRIAELDLGPDQVLDLVTHRAMAITNSHGAAIAIAQAGVVVCRARAGSMAPALGAHLDPDSKFSGACLRNGEVLCCDDSEADSRVNLGACRQLGIRSILAVPVRREQRVIGILEVFSRWVGAFGAREAQTLQLLAGLVSEAFRTADLRAAASTQAPSPLLATEAVVAQTLAPCAPVSTTKQPPSPAAVAAANLNTLENYIQSHQAPASRRALLMIGLAIVSVSSIWFWRAKERITPAPAAGKQPMATPLPVPAPAASEGEPAEISAIRFNSRPEFTGIALDLTAAGKYESHRLSHPDRVFFDLENTRLAQPLLSSGATIEVHDAFVSSIRVAQKGPNSRVVLDLNCACDYSSVVSLSPPYRLMIEVHRQLSPPAQAPRAATPPHTSMRETVRLPAGVADERSSPSNALHFRIVIDPGHGGTDLGTVGHSGLQEKDLVLDIAQRLGKLVSERSSAEVIYTRTDDRFVALQTRSALANSMHADLFVSIHANSSADRSVRGVETFYMDPRSADRMRFVRGANDEGVGEPRAVSAKIAASRRLAATVQHALYRRLAAADPRLRDRGAKAGSLVVLLGPNMPSILSEISFVSSPTEERNLKNPTYRDRIAEALYRGIKTYVSRTAIRKSYAVNRASGRNDEEHLRSD